MHSFDLPNGRRLHMNGDFSGDAIISPEEIRVSLADVLTIAEFVAVSRKEQCWDLDWIDSEMEYAKAIPGLRLLRRRYEAKSAPEETGADDMCQCGRRGDRPVFHATWCEIKIDWSD